MGWLIGQNEIAEMPLAVHHWLAPSLYGPPYGLGNPFGVLNLILEREDQQEHTLRRHGGHPFVGPPDENDHKLAFAS